MKILIIVGNVKKINKYDIKRIMTKYYKNRLLKECAGVMLNNRIVDWAEIQQKVLPRLGSTNDAVNTVACKSIQTPGSNHHLLVKKENKR